MSRRSHHSRAGRRGQWPQHTLHTPNTDFVMNEAKRGVGSGSGTNPSFSFAPPATTPTTQTPILDASAHREPAMTDWGMGDPEWGESPNGAPEDQGRSRPPREPLPPQSVVFSSTSQPRRTASAPNRDTPMAWRGSIFQNTIGNITAGELRTRQQSQSQNHTSEDDRDSRRPPRRPRSPESRDLVSRAQDLGIPVSYRYDSDIPWDARGIIEDLLFQLDQKANEVNHLQRKVENAARASRVHKRDESIEDRRPSKRREYSNDNDSSFGPSPIIASRSFGPPATGITRDDRAPPQGRTAPLRQPLAAPTRRIELIPSGKTRNGNLKKLS